jgi:hypothetical protein
MLPAVVSVCAEVSVGVGTELSNVWAISVVT